MRDYTIKVGDTSLSPMWAVVLNGAGVDLEDGWTVRAQARDYQNALVLDWDRDGSILIGSAAVEVPQIDGTVETVTASTIRLYLPIAFTATLRVDTLTYDVEITNPTAGPLSDPLRYTIVDGASVTIRRDWAPNG